MTTPTGCLQQASCRARGDLSGIALIGARRKLAHRLLPGWALPLGMTLPDGLECADPPPIGRKGRNGRRVTQFEVDACDRIIEKHRVVPRCISRVFRRRIGYLGIALQQEVFVEGINLASASRPQGNVMDAGGVLLRMQLAARGGRLNTYIAVKKREPSPCSRLNGSRYQASRNSCSQASRTSCQRTRSTCHSPALKTRRGVCLSISLHVIQDVDDRPRYLQDGYLPHGKDRTVLTTGIPASETRGVSSCPSVHRDLLGPCVVTGCRFRPRRRPGRSFGPAMLRQRSCWRFSHRCGHAPQPRPAAPSCATRTSIARVDSMTARRPSADHPILPKPGSPCFRPAAWRRSGATMPPLASASMQTKSCWALAMVSNSRVQRAPSWRKVDRIHAQDQPARVNTCHQVCFPFKRNTMPAAAKCRKGWRRHGSRISSCPRDGLDSGADARRQGLSIRWPSRTGRPGRRHRRCTRARAPDGVLPMPA